MISDFDGDLKLWVKILCFIFFPLGLILYFIYKENEPTKSKSAGVWALGGFIIGLVLRILI